MSIAMGEYNYNYLCILCLRNICFVFAGCKHLHSTEIVVNFTLSNCNIYKKPNHKERGGTGV